MIVRRSIWMGLLILHIMGVAATGEKDMEEIIEKDVNTYMLAKDYCSVDEFEDMDYYLLCNTQLNKGAGSFEPKSSIISNKTQTIEEAKGLHQEFLERLPLDLEKEDEEEKTNVVYISPDCKWVITNKWNYNRTVSTQTLFYKKEKIGEKVTEIENAGVYPILIVKNGNQYKEMDEAYYEKLSEMTSLDFYDGGYNEFKKINAEGELMAEIKDNYSLLTIRKVEDGTEAWSFPLQGILEAVKKIRNDIQEKDTVMVVIRQFEGNEDEGWMTVQAGPSSFFRIAYPSGEVTYLGEYLYSLCFSPDGKYAAYSNVEYDDKFDIEPEEKAQMPPQGIYIREVETGKTAYIYWDPSRNSVDNFMDYRDFIWIEKEAFEEYMQTGSKD
ncbi:MAG: hypothetical protein ACI4C4_13980 [Lachnospiraceae bacterium]